MIAADALERGIETLGAKIGGAQINQLERYLDLLEKWNRAYNLTAIRERERMVTHHLLDSLAILPYVQGLRILDVGSGAGLPGIPLAVADPALRVVLLDSNQKKAAFVRQAVVELNLTNAEVHAERAEAWRTDMRFDTIVTRAFAELAEFVSASARLLAPGGALLAMKGQYPLDEINRLPTSFRAKDVVKLHVPQLDAERHLVIMEPAA
jgi:16S rRNA (guanine527-N7)-methyltransferase